MCNCLTSFSKINKYLLKNFHLSLVGMICLRREVGNLDSRFCFGVPFPDNVQAGTSSGAETILGGLVLHWPTTS
jgi:hypothetical protein